MKRNLHLLVGLAFLGLAGCSDNLPAVLRDYYNVENEAIDHLVFVCDDASAKRYNDLYQNRLKPKEEEIRERLDKLNKQQITQADQKLFADLHLSIEEELKGEIGGLDGRYRKEQARIRRIIVKLTEDKVEETKPVKDTSFTVEANQIWPNLSNPAAPRKFGGASDGFGANPNAGGGGQRPAGAGGPPAGMMMGGGMMGGAAGGPPGAPPGMGMPPGMGAPPGMGGPAGGSNNNPTFSIHCERIVNPAGQKDWRVTRRWTLGATVVDKLEINGINLVPLFSDAGGG
jgi:hypothetical protein